MSMYTIKEIINLIERVQDSMVICDPMVYPSPVRALDVHALLTVARENIQLQAKIEAALAIEDKWILAEGYDFGYHDAHYAFRKALKGDE